MKKYYKNYIGFKSIFYFCSLPLRLDSYRGCSYGCLYCFSQFLNNRCSDFFYNIVPANPLRFKRLMEGIHDNENRSGLVRSCIRRKIPVHLGSISDPFQPIELNQRVTFEFLRTLKKYNYPCVISTKSDLILRSEYLSLICDPPLSVQISFSSLDNDIAKKIEPYAPLPTKRLSVLHRLAESGVWTVARLQPILYPKEEVKAEIFEKLADVGVKHIVMEHLRIPTNSKIDGRAELWDALDKDFLTEYRKIGLRCSRVNYELCSEVKLENILKAREFAHSYGMSFGSGDNDFHHISDQLCCCSVPNDKNYENIYNGHLGTGIRRAVKTGQVSFDYIDKLWQPIGSTREYVNSDCRLPETNSIVGLLKDRLNKPWSSNSPTSFYGIELQENGQYSINSRFLVKLK